MILVGAYAQKYYLGADAGPTLTATVRNYRQFVPSRLPLAHPSPLNFRWQKQNPWFAAEVLPLLATWWPTFLSAADRPTFARGQVGSRAYRSGCLRVDVGGPTERVIAST